LIKASVVIPVYNNPDGLKKVLASLVKQEFPKNEYEIIVVDNGSTDDTLDIAKTFTKNFPDLVQHFVENKIKSSYAARNTGIKVAKGNVIAFTDSDCIPDKNWLIEGYKSLIQNDVSMVAGKIKFTFKNSKPNIWEYFDAAGKLNQKSYVENTGFGATANLFVLKRMFDKYGLFLSDLKSGGDYEFGRRLTQSGEVLLYEENSLVFHTARSGFRSKLAKSRRIAEGQRILAEMDLLDHGKLDLKQLLLTKYYPSLSEIKLKINEKIMLVLINNFFRYYNFFKRIKL